MGSGADWLQSHSTGRRALTLVACFLLAIAVAWLIGVIVYPGSEIAPAACAAALIMTLGVGYKLWAAFAAATLTRHLFGGFFAAALRFLFSRQPRDSAAAMDSLKRSLQDRDTLDALLVRLRARARVFALLGWANGAIAGIVVGAFTASPGFVQSALLLTAVGGAYGTVLTRLARIGLLPPPMEGD